MTSRIETRVYPDMATLSAAVARTVAGDLSSALGERARASLVVPGGTTPGPFFDELSRQSLDWPRVTVTVSDERWVGADDSASNEYLVRSRLLKDRAARAGFVSWRTAGETREAASRTLESKIAALWPFDVCVLGLGADGHIASLIPGAEGFNNAMHGEGLVAPVTASGAAGAAERLTLTWRAIERSRRIVVITTGASKRAVFEAAMKGDGAQPVVALLTQTETPVLACWCPEPLP